MRWLTSKLTFLQGRTSGELTLAFALGTFATCLFVFVPLFAIYLTGDLGNQLDGLDSRIGIVLFVLLWLPTVVCTIGAVADVGLDGLRGEPVSRLVIYGAKWGAFNGCAVLFMLLLAGVLLAIVDRLVEGEPEVLFIWVPALAIAIIGSPIAGSIGAVAGFLAALVELPLVMIARSVASRPGSSRDAGS